MRRSFRLPIVIALTIMIPIVPFAIIGELPGERWLSASDDNALVFGLTGAGLLVSDLLLPIPSSIIGTLLGARLGFIAGTLWAWAGLMVGSLVGYAIGRLLFTRFALTLPQTPTMLIVFLSRPVPVLAEAVTFAAGAGQMATVPYLLVSMVANGLVALALAGNGAAFLPDALAGPGLALPMLLPVAGWLVWQRHARRQQQAIRP